jgi:PKD repeat protein
LTVFDFLFVFSFVYPTLDQISKTLIMAIITIRRKLLILLLIVFNSAALFANNSPELQLKSGTYTLPENTQQFISNPYLQGEQAFNGKYFRIIQFYQLPGEAEKELLNSNGIRLVSYLPTNAFTAVISETANLHILISCNARSIVPMLAEWKMNRELLAGNYPSWALPDNKHIDLTVRYYGGLQAGEIVAALMANGAEIIKQYDYSSWIHIRTTVSSINTIAALAFVSGLEPIAKPPTADDEKGRSLHRSNAINSYSPMGRHYDGTGVSVALADDGPVGPHIDYQGRIDQSNTTSNNGNHGDMTTGILMGGGNLDPTKRGMGTGAFIYIYDIGPYSHILNSPITNQTLGVMVTSTSYSQGCNDYTTDTQTGDQILNQNPTLLHVFSAGNNGPGDCNYGAGGGWGNITGGYKQGKNVIACGNLSYLDVLESSSSRGPAEDGRIKPDICANGVGQMSTDGPNLYQVGGGTSAASPGIAGIVTQLHQAFRELNSGQNAEGALIKACLLNTAEDLGNPGPDFQFGWGRVNALRAVTTMEDNRYLSDIASQGSNNVHLVTVPAGTKQVRIMCYWNDVEGDPIAVKALVNDLNMTVTDPAATLFNPWVLNSTPSVAALTSNAVRAVDDLNNMEQVTIDNPQAGVYTINVNGFLVPQGPQKYYIVYEFLNDAVNVTYPIGAEGFVPGETETVRWDAYENTLPFTLEYSTDLGNSWTTVTSAIPAAQRYFNWTVPNTVTSEAMVRITRGTVSAQNPEPFTIIGLPSNVQVTWACPDSIRLTWNAVPNAAGYEVSMLGNMYMDSVAFSTVNYAVVTPYNPTVEHWFSVRAITAAGSRGRRCLAVYQPAGTNNCPIAIDATANQVISPAGSISNCLDLSSSEIIINVQNNGLTPISSIPVYYSINNSPPLMETISATINSFASLQYAFTATYDFSVAGIYNIKAWTDYPADGNSYNDTISATLNVTAGTLQTLPYAENFEAFSNCATTTDCEQTLCGLANGWLNVTNLQGDDIDWRTSEGSTPSVATGPDADHNPGTVTGNYIYLEASACFNKAATAISPCIDLTTAANPEFAFWYHMYGTSMGVLHTDVFYNDAWQNDIIPPISGNFGNQWQQQLVNLAPYAGEIVMIRFRGLTGPDYESDMAIDDISIYEINSPPVAAFLSNATSICSGDIVTLTDLSQNSPNSWSWTITPATGITYVNGTTSTSQNPQVQFSAAGIYDISLTVSNSFGSSNSTLTAFMQVDMGAAVPLLETFQSANFPPINWIVENVDGSNTWQPSVSVTGAAGTPTIAAYMNNYTYNALGQEDGLISEYLDLTNAISPLVTFDVAHARYSADFEDALRIDISTDCGVTYVPSGYLKTGLTLATVPDQNTVYYPALATDWRNDTLSLASYAGQKIYVKFVNITGYGNSLYIDNINYSESSLSINENQVLLNAEVYPNPGKGIYTLDINSNASSELRMHIYDMKGSNILTADHKLYTGKNSIPINITAFGKGIYMLDVTAGQQQYKIKLVVL